MKTHHQHRREQHISFGILDFLRENRNAIESDEHQRGQRSSGSQCSQIKRGRIVNRLQRKQPGKMIVQHDVAEGFHQKDGGDQHHEAEQHFVRARGEFDSLHRHYGDQSDGNGRQNGERNARHHALNRQHRVERVLNGLKKIFQKHRPADHESEVRVQFPADVGVDRTGRGIHAGHAAEADGGD